MSYEAHITVIDNIRPQWLRNFVNAYWAGHFSGDGSLHHTQFNEFLVSHGTRYQSNKRNILVFATEEDFIVFKLKFSS